jgi:hypothetical protein
MKFLFIFAIIMGAFAITVPAQELGLEIVPAAESPARRDTMVITYTELEDRPVQFYEAALPADSEGGCFASRDFTGAQPIPPDRVSQTFGEGKKVVIVFIKTDRRGPCNVIFGRTVSSGLVDVAVWSFGSDSEANPTRSAGHRFSLERHFDS